MRHNGHVSVASGNNESHHIYNYIKGNTRIETLIVNTGEAELNIKPGVYLLLSKVINKLGL